MADLLVELVAATGEVIASEITEADGYYVLSGIPVGEYHLRVSPSQMQRMSLRCERYARFGTNPMAGW